MIPLELGYVREAEGDKLLNSCSERVAFATFMITSINEHKCIICTAFFLMYRKKNLGGEGKPGSNLWLGARRVRWPTTPRVAKS